MHTGYQRVADMVCKKKFAIATSYASSALGAPSKDIPDETSMQQMCCACNSLEPDGRHACAFEAMSLATHALSMSW